jgi:hypothetical protein
MMLSSCRVVTTAAPNDKQTPFGKISNAISRAAFKLNVPSSHLD